MLIVIARYICTQIVLRMWYFRTKNCICFKQLKSFKLSHISHIIDFRCISSFPCHAWQIRYRKLTIHTFDFYTFKHLNYRFKTTCLSYGINSSWIVSLPFSQYFCLYSTNIRSSSIFSAIIDVVDEHFISVPVNFHKDITWRSLYSYIQVPESLMRFYEVLCHVIF